MRSALRGAVFWPLAALAIAVPGHAAGVEIEARFETPVVGIDQVAEFWIEVRSGLARSPDFQPEFELLNLESLGRPNRAESFRFVDGATARSLRLTWTLQPLGLGEAAVHSIRVRVGNETFDLPTERIEVVAQAPPGPSRPGLRDPFQRSLRRLLPRQRPSPPPATGIFLRAEVTPESPYTGQQMVYTLYLFTQADISAIHPRRIPSFQGFWAHEIPPPREPTPEMVEVQGHRYGRVPLLQRVLFPRRPGWLEIEAAEYDLVAQMVTARPLGSPLRHPEQVRRRGNRLRVGVRELPQGPPGYSGAVGRLALEARIEPREVAVGESSILTVTLSGDGHIQSLAPPEPLEIPGVSVLPPEELIHEEVDAGRIAGQRSWRFVLVPREVGNWLLEPLSLSYFDPSLEAYRIAASAPLRLTATEARGDSEIDPRTALGAGLNPIRSAVVPTPDELPWHRLLPWLFAVPFALALTLRLARMGLFSSWRQGSDPAVQTLRARLEEIEAAGEGEGRISHRQAAAQIEHAWSTYLTDRWSLPPGLPAGQWSAEVAMRSAVGRWAPEAFGRLADEILYLRQAPQLSTTGSLLLELLQHSRRLVRKLP